MAEGSRDCAELRRAISLEVRNQGAWLLGVADLSDVLSLAPDAPQILAQFPRAISLAVPLSQGVMGTLETGPTRLYLHHYKTVNVALDQLALRVSCRLEEAGFPSLPVPASGIVVWRPMQGHLSHKRIAVLAGAGWIGLNNLLVTPRWGCGLRLVTILTQAPLPADRPIEGSCAGCQACITACPSGAIHRSPSEFDLDACFTYLDQVTKRENLGQHICGLCQKVCMACGNHCSGATWGS